MQTFFTFDPQTEKNLQNWLLGDIDSDTKKAIEHMRKNDPKKLQDSFFSQLSFGTGGMRGLLGVGSNRLNLYTIRLATLALARYLKQTPSPHDSHAVLIGYDSRHGSREFAETAATVLGEEKIHALIFDKLHPAPLVSFGCREKKCSAAIMITASHNPPQYNGYKVYWSDGGQVLPPHDTGILEEMKKLSDGPISLPDKDIEPEWQEWIGNEIDNAYLDAIETLQTYPVENAASGRDLHIVYTSLHGTGIVIMEKALKRWGMSHVSLVKDQVIPDGNFPTCPSPNPEEKKALSLGIETMQQVGGDILIATDPDADRVGVAVLHKEEIHLLTGNQVACLCLEHLLEGLNQQGRLPENAAFIKTIVTTELFRKIAEKWHKLCFDVLTGFKYIAEKIREWEVTGVHQFIFGGEESYGYLLGTYSRDKDGIVSSCLIAEAALKAKREGKTLIDKLHDLYRVYGVHYEELFSLNFEDTKENKEMMKEGLASLKKNPPRSFNGIPVEKIEDYQLGQQWYLSSDKKEPILLPTTDALRFVLSGGTCLTIRPSGTEPKIKIYCGIAKDPSPDLEKSLDEAKQEARLHIETLKSLFNRSKKESSEPSFG